MNVNEKECDESNALTEPGLNNDSSDNEQISKNDKYNSKQPRSHTKSTFRSKMYLVFREIYFLILIVLTYAAFQNSTPKVSKSPKAYPFFPKGSLVKDYFNGDLSDAIELASQSDLAFVMYYAPWDSESQSVRQEFNLAAVHMHENIHFVAINCWQPNSECRQQYSKVYSWPVLMAYPSHGRGIQYRGIKRHEYMIQFLQYVAKPLKRITKLTEINEHQSSNDAVVVGFMDVNPGSNDFGVFYSSALRFLERDPFQEVQFLIYTEKIQNMHLPMLQLYLWNETLVYPESADWAPESINIWVSDNLHQVSLWATLPGSKSTILANYLTPGPALVLFTPRNPLYNHIDYYSVLHGVALDYYNCENNLGINLQKTYLKLLRKGQYNEYKKLENTCLVNKKIKKDSFATVVTYDLNRIWINNSCSNKNLQPKQNFCYGKKINKNICSNVISSDEIKLNTQKVLDNFLETSPIAYTEKTDPKSPENLQKQHKKEKCYYFRLANKIHANIVAPLNSTGMDSVNISGLACKTNISLSIIALDVFEYHHFAENLGIDVLKIPDKSATVILNPKLETHHVMENEYTIENLNNFINNFTKGKLDRTLSSQINLRTHTHLYDFKNTNNVSENVFQIEELTTNNFFSTTMQPDKAVIVTYYSTKCGFCSGISHILLETAKALSSINEVKFARIDGDNHALPWEYSMHHFPSILYFPPRRKSESRVFPRNVPISVPNLLAFILANVDSNIKIKIMWSVCNQTKFSDDVHKCINTVKNECMTLIGKILRVFRVNYDVPYRTTLLKQLENIRSLYFELSANYINNKQINKYINSLRTIDLSQKMFKKEHFL